MMSETFKKVSLSRILQSYYFKKFNIIENENVIEFGSNINSSKSFYKNINGNFSIDFADKLLGENNIRFDLEKENEVNKKYELVIIFNVLEHVYNPEKVMKSIHRVLKKNGLLVIIVPNVESLAASIMQSRCNMFLGMSHITMFSPITLKNFV